MFKSVNNIICEILEKYFFEPGMQITSKREKIFQKLT